MGDVAQTISLSSNETYEDNRWAGDDLGHLSDDCERVTEQPRNRADARVTIESLGDEAHSAFFHPTMACVNGVHALHFAVRGILGKNGRTVVVNLLLLFQPVREMLRVNRRGYVRHSSNRGGCNEQGLPSV